MTTITNNGRRLGIAGRPALILGPGQSAEVTEKQYRSFLENRTVARWIESGLLTVEDAPEGAEVAKPTPAKLEAVKAADPALPEGVKGEGVELHHVGAGWYDVYVNGFKVTDKGIRKPEAEAMVKEYE